VCCASARATELIREFLTQLSHQQLFCITHAHALSFSLSLSLSLSFSLSLSTFNSQTLPRKKKTNFFCQSSLLLQPVKVHSSNVTLD
jgi:hypothetical protein